MDLPFQDYVEQLLHPQDPTSLGNGEKLWRPRGGTGALGSAQVVGSLHSCVLVLADTLYFFGDNNFTEWASLLRHYSPPPFGLLGASPAYSFGIAGGWSVGPGHLGRWRTSGWVCSLAAHPDRTGAGSGVPFHWHGPGFSEVIYGRKVSTG